MNNFRIYPPQKKTLFHNLDWFYAILTTASYLMPNPIFTYIKYMICKHFRYIQLIGIDSSISNNSI